MNKAIISRARFTPDDFSWVREAAAAENLQIEGGSVLDGNVALPTPYVCRYICMYVCRSVCILSYEYEY